METLFIHTDFLKTTFFLKDSSGFCIGSFPSAEEAESWCKENGYRVRRSL